MKVKFNFGIGAFSGTVQEGTYCMSRDQNFSIMRKWVMPKLTDQNTEIGATGKNLGSLWTADASVDYKANFKTYAERYYSENPSQGIYDPCRSAFAFFTKAMWAWAEDESPAVDLKTVTIEDIGTLGGKVASVSDCVTNGYIPVVADYGDLDSPI